MGGRWDGLDGVCVRSVDCRAGYKTGTRSAAAGFSRWALLGSPPHPPLRVPGWKAAVLGALQKAETSARVSGPPGMARCSGHRCEALQCHPAAPGTAHTGASRTMTRLPHPVPVHVPLPACGLGQGEPLCPLFLRARVFGFVSCRDPPQIGLGAPQPAHARAVLCIPASLVLAPWGWSLSAPDGTGELGVKPAPWDPVPRLPRGGGP